MARPVHPAMLAYETWMRDDRGLSGNAIRLYRADFDELFGWLATNELPLSSVTLTDVDGAIAAKNATGRYSRRTIRRHRILTAPEHEALQSGMATG